MLIVKENNILKNTNIYLTESSIKQNSETLASEKITTTQLVNNVIKPIENQEQNYPNLRMTIPGPKEVFDSKMINQS